MAYDQGLAHRLTEALSSHDLPEIEEKKMFGGFALMVRGNLCCGVVKDELLVRVNTDRVPALLKRKGARTFEAMSSHPMPGWILVAPDKITEDDELSSWLAPAIENAMALPPKAKKPAKAAAAPKAKPRKAAR